MRSRYCLPLLAAFAAAGCSSGDAPVSGAVEAASGDAAAASPTLRDPRERTDCDGRDVEIGYSDASIVLDGRCGRMTLGGSRLAVNVDEAEAIEVTGDEVTVINNRKAGIVVAHGDGGTLNLTDADEVTLHGSRNTVLAFRIGRLRIEGSGNTVNWNEGATTADGDGRDNTLIR